MVVAVISSTVIAFLFAERDMHSRWRYFTLPSHTFGTTVTHSQRASVSVTLYFA